jgi:Trypsin
MKYSDRLLSALPLAASLLWAGSAYSADAVIKNPSSQRELSDVDISKAKPHSNPLPPPDTSKTKAEPDYMLFGVPGAAPGSEPAQTPEELPMDERAYGTFGIPYTSTRVALGGSNQTSAVGGSFLSSTYPYRTIGKLTFSAGYCSASLIRRSVIVTAAHCIQNFGSGSSTFSNWQFTPGHYGPSGATAQQIRPYGTWNWSAYVRPATGLMAPTSAPVAPETMIWR